MGRVQRCCRQHLRRPIYNVERLYGRTIELFQIEPENIVVGIGGNTVALFQVR